MLTDVNAYFPALREKSNFSRNFKLICPVQSSLQKYFSIAVGQISGLNPPVSPDKRGDRDRHERAVRCGGRDSND